MERTRFDSWPCALARASDVVADAWTPLILREAFCGATRFDEFADRLGMSRGSLSRRLRHLTEAGVFERELYVQRPARYRYELTTMGRDLMGVVACLLSWGQAWLGEDVEGDTRLIDPKSGRELRVAVVDRRTQEEVDPGRFELTRDA